MNAKEAVNTAKAYIIDTFAEEKIRDVGLEELEFDPDEDLWEITIGFWRADNRPDYSTNTLGLALSPRTRRSFKIVKIDNSGNVIALKNHPIESAHV